MCKLLIISLLLLSSCGKVKEITSSLMDLRQIRFELNRIDDPVLQGIPINEKFKLNELSINNLLALEKSFSRNEFFLSFNLIVDAKNPNEAKGKSITTKAVINSFPYDLRISDVIVASGNIKKSITLPANGEIVEIPLGVNINLYDIYTSKSYKELFKVALNIAGFNTDKLTIELDAKPEIQTRLGDLSPGRITIKKQLD